jgi:hypothetical protein
MNERPFTRPPAGTPEYYEGLGEEYDRRGNYNRNSANVFSGDNGKSLWLSITLGVSWVLMGALYYEFRELAQESRLKQYNMDWFRTHEFAELNDKVAVQDKMLGFLQTRTACTK